MRTLERITVTGYKSIRELRDFALGDLNVLIGANGAGKSNFLSLFKLFKSLANDRLQLFIGNEGGADYLLHFGAKITDQIELKLKFNYKYYQLSADTYEALLGFAKPNKLIFRQEEFGTEIGDELNQPKKNENLGVGHEESNLYEHEESNLYEAVVLNPIRSILKDVYFYHFQDTTDKAKVKFPHNVHDDFRLKSDAANLGAFLYRLKKIAGHQSVYNQIIKTIRLIAPFFDDFVLTPENQLIRLQWKHRNSNDNFDAHQFSDGTLRFICLATLLLQPNPPSLIIIDEPELGLHPAAMELLVEMLRSVTTKSQVIISTQSVEMVNYFLPEEIIVVDREKDESVFHRKSAKELEAMPFPPQNTPRSPYTT